MSYVVYILLSSLNVPEQDNFPLIEFINFFCFLVIFLSLSFLQLFVTVHPNIIIWISLASNLQVKYLAEAVGAGMGGPVQGFLKKILQS